MTESRFFWTPAMDDLVTVLKRQKTPEKLICSRLQELCGKPISRCALQGRINRLKKQTGREIRKTAKRGAASRWRGYEENHEDVCRDE